MRQKHFLLYNYIFKNFNLDSFLFKSLRMNYNSNKAVLCCFRIKSATVLVASLDLLTHVFFMFALSAAMLGIVPRIEPPHQHNQLQRQLRTPAPTPMPKLVLPPRTTNANFHSRLLSVV